MIIEPKKIMKFIDTHTHIYLDNYDIDRDEIVKNAIDHGVNKMLMPAIDSSTFKAMIQLSNKYPNNCFPMIGLHPTSAKENYDIEMKFVETELKSGDYIGIGEIGIDLYWDKSFINQQRDAFRRQLQLAKKYSLPVAIHTRDSFDEIYPILKAESTEELCGVFHCFTGTATEAEKIIDLGFMLGIGGIITFKNSGLDSVAKNIPIEHILLETDSPFLTPTPYRGKRNQSAYITYIATKLAEVKGLSTENIAEITTNNANKLFKLA